LVNRSAVDFKSGGSNPTVTEWREKTSIGGGRREEGGGRREEGGGVKKFA
jgi:hypothetical protein